MEAKLFLVEDDVNFGSILKSYLEMNDFYVVWVDDGAKAYDAFQKDTFDLCILDIMLPNIDGFEIAKQIKSLSSKTPFVFLTAKTLKNDIVEGYKLGADDYITKPFDSEVLLYKIRAILNRNAEEKSNGKEQLGNFIFDINLRLLVDKNGVEQKLSPKEAELLKMFCQYKNQVLPRKEALIQIWGDDNYFTTRSMDVFITKLRKIFKKDSSVSIENIHSSGYRMYVNKSV